jgi:iron-sulfur cluster assembly accessory protein
MIELTERAVEAVKTAMAKAARPVDGLRIQVASGGCAGLQYRLGLEAEPRDDDVVIDHDGGVRLYVGPESQTYVEGMTVDFVTRIDRTGFVFENPNARSKCNCGSSFC